MTENTITDGDAAQAKAQRDTALRKAYGLATADLRKAHQDEFNSYYASHAKELGQEWTPQETPEQKAAKQITELLAKHPSLAQTIAAQVTQPKA